MRVSNATRPGPGIELSIEPTTILWRSVWVWLGRPLRTSGGRADAKSRRDNQGPKSPRASGAAGAIAYEPRPKPANSCDLSAHGPRAGADGRGRSPPTCGRGSPPGAQTPPQALHRVGGVHGGRTCVRTGAAGPNLGTALWRANNERAQLRRPGATRRTRERRYHRQPWKKIILRHRPGEDLQSMVGAVLNGQGSGSAVVNIRLW